MARGTAKLPHGIAAQNSVIRRYRQNAARRGIRNDLTDNQMIALFQQPCYYCGVAPSATVKNSGFNGNFLHNGIDRRDNNLPYTVDNAVACCSFCNHAKSTHSEEEFLSWLMRAYKHNIGDN